MKRILFAVLVCISVVSFAACRAEPRVAEEGELVHDTEGIIYNPDMGFYSAVTVKMTKDGISDFSDIKKKIKKAPTLFSGRYSSEDKFALIHLKMDISSFSRKNNSSTDETMTQAALDDLNELLSCVEEAEKTAIIRFAYDPEYKGKKDGKKYADVEPVNFDNILYHIDALCPVLKNHVKCLTAVECGMIGPWGEMHSTTYAKGITGDELYYIRQVIERFLDGLDGSKLPLLVRQPRFIYDCIGNDYTSGYSVQQNSKYYTLGIYNDGYLGSEGDLGTFKGKRAQEVEFLKQFTDHTPYGGELCDGDDKDPALWRTNLKAAMDEMKDVHLSFLNIGWNHRALSELCNKRKYSYNGEQAFIYIIKHMGYRYAFKDASATINGGNLNVSFNIENSGFADMPMQRQKKLRVYFEKKDGTIVNQNGISVSGKTFVGSTRNMSFSIQAPSEPGTYRIYLRFADSDGKYAVRFADTDWNESLKANFLCSVTVD